MSNNVLELRTSDELLHALQSSAGRSLTASEILQQRVSFVCSSMKPDSGITRERVRQVIEQQDGVAA